jgi:hypothetical protein
MARKIAELRARMSPDAQARAAARAEAMQGDMKPEYDFSTTKARPNPYASKLKIDLNKK